jgi:4-hydroxy-2-oxoheptanedioate aldolase
MAIGRETLAWMCQNYRANGLPPIVRTPSPDPFEACVVLDAGAVGILAPYVETAEQVLALVGATKLRPLKGKRLRTVLASPDKLEPELKSYMAGRNADNLLFINIESVPAMDALDELLSVPGLDGIIIGPHDLSCSLALPEDYRNPTFKKAVKEIIRKACRKGKPVGIHFSEEPEMQIEWAQAGVDIVLHSSDISLFGKTLNNDIMKIKQALEGDVEVREYTGEVI